MVDTNRHAASIRRRRATLERQSVKLDASMQLLQIECRHPAAVKKYGANSGNYDSSADSYWIDHMCPDCGKKWRTDQ